MAQQIKHIPDDWIKEKQELLSKKLPPEPQKSVFLPDDYFYLQYIQKVDNDPQAGLHYMATVLFDWLKISPNGCLIDFYDEAQLKNKSADAAGLYTKINNGEREQEVILINKKHTKDSFAVAAILAHEMMHLFLHRNNIELEDAQENELLTDLATIQTGLAVLILNGMSKETQWLMTILALCIGMLYWRSEQKAFGYFRPGQYGAYAKHHFDEKKMPLNYLIGHVQPSARYFIPGAWFVRAKKKTMLIKYLEKKRLKTNLIQGIIAVIAISFVLWFAGNEDKKTKQINALNPQILSCKSDVDRMETEILGMRTRLKNMESEMARYENSGNISKYNQMVTPYNQLLNEINSRINVYDKAVDDCNEIIDRYNSL